MEPTLLYKQRWRAASRRDCKIRIPTWTGGNILLAGGRSLLTSRQAPYYVQSRLKTS